MLFCKATQLAKLHGVMKADKSGCFEPTKGWFWRFCERYSIRSRYLCGESQELDVEVLEKTVMPVSQEHSQKKEKSGKLKQQKIGLYLQPIRFIQPRSHEENEISSQ